MTDIKKTIAAFETESLQNINKTYKSPQALMFAV